MIDFRSSFEAGLPLEQFLAQRGTPGDQHRWNEEASRIQLSEKQRQLISRFRRRMQVLCMASAWCGDCARQCPIIHVISQSTDVIEIRFRDRDDDPRLAEELMICGSPRIPQVVFLDEDGNHVGRFGDRTLANYRELVAELDGVETNDSAPAAKQVLDSMVQDWLNEFERIQWLLRTSPRLRARHRD